jgi:hypothetical protein
MVRDDFACRIQVKENGPELLRRALSRVPADLVGTGDYQPAERKYGLSRQMLEVCLEGSGPDLPDDGSQGSGEYRECGAQDGGGDGGATRLWACVLRLTKRDRWRII